MSVKLIVCLETDLQEAKHRLQHDIKYPYPFWGPEEIKQLRQQKKNINASVQVSHRYDSTIFKPLWLNAMIEEIKIPHNANYSEGTYKLDELLKIRK